MVKSRIFESANLNVKMYNMKSFSKKIFVGITGYKDSHWKNKLKEIDEFGLKEVSLFFERFDKRQRKEICKALLETNIKSIPLVHIENKSAKEELSFLSENFGSKYFTIHEKAFNHLEIWKGFFKDLYLEMNTDDFVSDRVDVSRIGGFCIDLSHFKVEMTKWSKEFEYIFERKSTSHYFDCNHLNGYSYKKNTDLHAVKSLKDFDYLKTLPKFLFGDIIGIETDNPISEQLKFKEYLVEMLDDLFAKK